MPSYGPMDGTTRPLHCSSSPIACGAFGAVSKVGGSTVGPLWIAGATTRTSGEDPTIFATALEMLAIKAFVDMGQTARLHIIRDRFIAGHSSCELRQHLDSVSPETPMQDIVDRCRVWESHADLDVRRASKPGPDPTYPTYAVSGSDGGMDDLRVAAVTTPQSVPDQLETLFR